jgi:NAD(P)-dependent dehydrogenase (short-subunit alcohol dehydrogenase family)
MNSANGSHKICVVTGATSGIGLEIATAFAARGERVIGVGRDPGRCAAARAAIAQRVSGAKVTYEVADLSRQADVRTVARAIRASVDRIDVLVNNAGTFTARRRETADGLETQLAVNWLAGFALTGLLLPLLRAADRARVVTISSGSHFAGRIRWNDIQLRRWYNGLKAYDQSKLATVLFTRELARRLGPGSSVSTYAVDPGLVRTEIGAKGGGPLVGLVWGLRVRGGISAGQAAQSVVWCALDEEASGRTGLYWKQRATVTPSMRAQSPGDAARLWELGEKLSGVSYC